MAANRKKLITEISANLFRNKGYNATSMRDIADEVGVEAASLYNHIKSKNDILQIIVFQITNICNEHLGYVLSNKETPLQKIEGVIRFHVKLMLKNYNAYHVTTHSWKNLDQPDLTKFVVNRKHYVTSLEAIVQQGIDDGQFKPIIPYIVVLNILSAVMGLEFWHMSNKKYDEVLMEDNIVMHLLTGLSV
jgi:TetR/AcrR family transcriptional regulator, cholesterol catabolism regulator